MDNLKHFEARIAAMKKNVIKLKGESIFKKFEKENNLGTMKKMPKGKSHED